jgi:hypothetical protein
VVIDINGVHKVCVDYCGCTVALERVDQLLQVRWYPATTVNPKSAATFNSLEYFQLLTFESKASAFQYYNSLSRRTDNTGLGEVPVCSWLSWKALFLLTFCNSGPLSRVSAHDSSMAPSQNAQASWAQA